MQFKGLIQTANDTAREESCGDAAWQLPELSGRLVEISAQAKSAVLSFCAGLILQVQEQGGHCIWLSRNDSSFYPPDFAARGIDLSALPVVRSKTLIENLRAMERLLRSGAFSLILLDHQGHQKFPLHAQGRLAGLAKRHHSAVVCIGDRASDQGSMGSMVSLHVEASRHYKGEGKFGGNLHALKDKRRGPHWNISESFDAPPGLY